MSPSHFLFLFVCFVFLGVHEELSGVFRCFYLSEVVHGQCVIALAHTPTIAVPVYRLTQKPAGGVPVGTKDEQHGKEFS